MAIITSISSSSSSMMRLLTLQSHLPFPSFPLLPFLHFPPFSPSQRRGTRRRRTKGCSQTILSSSSSSSSFSSFSDKDYNDGLPPSSSPLFSHAKKAAKKSRTHYVCASCGEEHSQWWGRCQSCNSVNTLRMFREPLLASSSSPANPGGGAGIRAVKKEPLQQGTWLSPRTSPSSPQRLSDISRSASNESWRIPLVGKTGMEVSRVLGGGIVPGSLMLVCGDPGVGKSTLLLQIAGYLSEGCEDYEVSPVLYISGEESVEQISNRAERLNISSDNLFLYSATDLEDIMTWILKLKPKAVIIDSIQTVYLAESTGSTGSVTQIRECATALLRTAKQSRIPIFIVGHVTKTGEIAGPRVLEHIVDVVLYMEGEVLLSHRLLRAEKNRFGSTSEIGVFEMVEGGIQAVENPSKLFLSNRTFESNNATSAAVAVVMEGSRPLLVEIQALCLSTSPQFTKRLVNGVDPQRISLISAVLSKQAGLKLQSQDLYVNVVGGLRVREPAADLAAAIAVSSSYYDKHIPADMAFIGELGLAGEIRPVRQLERRVLEAVKLGFRQFVVPQTGEKSLKAVLAGDVTIISSSNIQKVIDRVLL